MKRILILPGDDPRVMEESQKCGRLILENKTVEANLVMKNLLISFDVKDHFDFSEIQYKSKIFPSAVPFYMILEKYKNQ